MHKTMAPHYAQTVQTSEESEPLRPSPTRLTRALFRLRGGSTDYRSSIVIYVVHLNHGLDVGIFRVYGLGQYLKSVRPSTDSPSTLA